MPSPLFSIVTATYNRGHVLRFAIGSVLRATETDWELIVVGDCCTDDTADVVASFGDPRIRFINLPSNHGEQSKPNNVGCAEARGRYLAFLNHDDMWLPGHLVALRRTLEADQADLAFALGIAITPGGPDALLCATASGEYEPSMFCPASSWLMRRELFERVGPWRSFREIHSLPSQEWIHRAWKAGARTRQAPQVTWVAIQSGWRAGSYLHRDSGEHQSVAERMTDEGQFLIEELTAIARDAAARHGDLGLRYPVRQIGRNLAYRAAIAAGISPTGLMTFLRYRRKGGAIDRLRNVRGLPPLP